ncbi:hypothetical protein S4A8_01690 [Salinisphaera sp. S4-8]
MTIQDIASAGASPNQLLDDRRTRSVSFAPGCLLPRSGAVGTNRGRVGDQAAMAAREWAQAL